MNKPKKTRKKAMRIKANSITLTDSDDRAKARIMVDEDKQGGVALHLWGKGGAQIALQVNNEGLAMMQFLTGVPARSCVDLYVTSENGATLTLRDREGRPNVIITAHTSLYPKIIVETGGKMVDLIEMLFKLEATVKTMSRDHGQE